LFLFIQEGVFCTKIWSFPSPFKARVGDLMQTIDLALEESCWNQINQSWWSKPWVESQSHKNEYLCATVSQ